MGAVKSLEGLKIRKKSEEKPTGEAPEKEREERTTSASRASATRMPEERRSPTPAENGIEDFEQRCARILFDVSMTYLDRVLYLALTLELGGRRRGMISLEKVFERLLSPDQKRTSNSAFYRSFKRLVDAGKIRYTPVRRRGTEIELLV